MKPIAFKTSKLGPKRSKSNYRRGGGTEMSMMSKTPLMESRKSK